MKSRLSLLIPLILAIVSLVSSFMIYLQTDRADRAAIQKHAMTEATLQMGGLQNGLYNRLTAGDEQQALLSLSLAATYPSVRTLMLVDEHHRVLMANRYSWKGELAGSLSKFADIESDRVFGSGISQLAFNGGESTLLQGYFPLITEYKQGGLKKAMGLLYVEYDISHELQAEKKETVAQALIFAAITLFSSGFIGILLHLLLTRRVNLLSAVSSRFAEGDYTVRTDLKGNDELSGLGRSFDLMAQRMTENIARQERQHTFLEEAQQIGHFGSWELDLLTGKLEWSAEMFRLLEIDPAQFRASHETFLNVIFHHKVKTTGFSRLALATIMRFLNGGGHGLQARKPYSISNRVSLCVGNEISLQSADRRGCRSSACAG